MSDVVQSVIDAQGCQEIQKQLFLFLVGKYINKKQIFRFNYEHCLKPSLPPIDIYLITKKQTSSDIQKCYQFIEVKAGTLIYVMFTDSRP